MVNHAIENITAESIEKSINYFSEAIEKYPFLRQDTYVNIDWIKEKQHKLQKEKFDKLLPQVYAAVKSGEIESFRYKGGYILTKDALIDYIVKTANGKGKLHYMLGEKNDK